MSRNTLAVYLVVLRGFYHEIKRYMAGSDSPFSSVCLNLRSGAKPRQPFTEDETVLLLSLPNRETTVGRRDYAILSLLFGAGLRPQEVLNLHPGDLVTGYGVHVIKLHNTKTVKYQEHSIAPWVAQALQEHLVGHFGYRVFELSSVGLWKMFKRYLKQGQIRDYSPGCGRTTAINHLLEDDVNHNVVRRFSRHSSVKMVEVYDRRRVDVSKNPGLFLVYGGKNGQR